MIYTYLLEIGKMLYLSEPATARQRSQPQFIVRAYSSLKCACDTARFRLCLLTALWLTAFATFAATTQTAAAQPPEWNATFQQLAKLEPGQDLAAFAAIDRAVSQARADANIRKALEASLIATLEGTATDLGKDYACRQLALVGSDTAVPALAQLLPNARLSHMARYALEGISGPAAAKALSESIAKTAGQQRVGAVISLGRLADPQSVPAVAALLDQQDDELRRAALETLGRIGTVPAADALQAFSAQAPAALKLAVVHAQIQAVHQLCRQGQHAAALKICASLESHPSEPVRAAAFRGRITAEPSKTAATILAGLAAAEPWKRAVAADCVTALDKPEDIQAVAAAVPGLATAGKIAALLSLKYRCHAAIRQAALKLLDSPEAEVRIAALTSLIKSGRAQDVAALADLAAKCQDATVRDTAFETLRLMTAQGTNGAIGALMADEKTLTPALVRCAVGRCSLEFTPGFLQAAAAADEAVRLEAFRALEVMATEKDATHLVDLLSKTPPGTLRAAAGRAVWMSCQKIVDPAQRAAPLLAAVKTADAAGKCALLPSLARLGGAGSLAAVHNAMQSEDRAVRDAGYRALANWPDASVADELLDTAKNGKDPAHRIWTLRAYARVVALPSDRPPQKTFEMLTAALELASRLEDKQLIVSRLASVRAPQALSLLVSYLDNAELGAAAVPAVFTLAKGLSQSHPDQAKAALEKVRPLTKDAAISQQISKVLRDIESRKQGQKKQVQSP